jgi:hypothetical protein
MKGNISYKNCVIRGESFQLAQSSGWIPRFILMRQDSDRTWNGPPSHHDRLDKVFGTKNEADEFAVQDAMRCVDRN